MFEYVLFEHDMFEHDMFQPRMRVQKLGLYCVRSQSHCHDIVSWHGRNVTRTCVVRAGLLVREVGRYPHRVQDLARAGAHLDHAVGCGQGVVQHRDHIQGPVTPCPVAYRAATLAEAMITCKTV